MNVREISKFSGEINGVSFEHEDWFYTTRNILDRVEVQLGLKIWDEKLTELLKYAIISCMNKNNCSGRQVELELGDCIYGVSNSRELEFRFNGDSSCFNNINSYISQIVLL